MVQSQDSSADAPEVSKIADLLSAGGPEQLAWGAYLAASQHQSQFVPSIVHLLRHQNRYVRLAAIDALIRLNADAPDEDLTSFTGPDVDPVLILASRAPARHTSLLMSFLDQPFQDQEWVAVNSILATSPVRGYVAKLFFAWKLTVTISVHDGPIGIGCGGAGYVFVDRDASDRTGFRPFAAYVVSERQISPEAVVMTTGPHPVSYIRQGSPAKGGGSVSRDRYRQDYLQYIAHAGFPTTDRDLHGLTTIGFLTTPAWYSLG